MGRQRFTLLTHTAKKPKEHALDAELFQFLTSAGLNTTLQLDVGQSVRMRTTIVQSSS
jgi:hypothetical protein